MRSFTVLLALLPLAGCASVTGPVVQADGTIFEVEYVNFAWAPTWRGAVIDTSGAIRSYDLKGQHWQPADADYPTAAELQSKYSQNTATAGEVSRSILADMQLRAAAAAGGPLSEPQNRCADAGTITYTAYIPDAARGAYRRVLLRQEGDVARLNQSDAGRAIASWLISLELIQQIQGCQP